MTFGCQMNVNDSDWLRRSLLGLGFAEAPFAEARVHILNTCSVREKPENKVYTELGRIRLLAREFPERDLIACVGGCVAQQLGEKLFARSRELKLVFGTDGIAHAPAAIALLAENSRRQISLLNFTGDYTERARPIHPVHPIQPVRPDYPAHPESQAARSSGPSAAIPPVAYVNIMQGCNNFCTYCIVPLVRGREKSRQPGAVLEECRDLVRGGARELTLLGQNVNSYEYGFVPLLYRVAEIPGLRRLRFITPHPKDVPAELVRAFAELEVLSPRLHLPLQSGSDRVLARMNRKYDLARYLELVRGLRAARPDIQLSTDIIVGFPGESEEDFAATLSAMRAADFAASFSFAYSDRPGAAASKFTDKVPHQVGLARLALLQDWQNANSARILQSLVGTEAEVLIEGQSLLPARPGAGPGEGSNGGPDGESPLMGLHGRDAYGFSVNIPLPPGRAPQPGELVKVKINGAGRHTLKGSLA
jgi:tRNA-2-methylthio-N6-dimethylallyladenosine synthase